MWEGEGEDHSRSWPDAGAGETFFRSVEDGRQHVLLSFSGADECASESVVENGVAEGESARTRLVHLR